MIRKFALAALSFAVAVTSHAGQFFQDFSNSNIGDAHFSDGSVLFSTTPSVAQVVNSPYKELQLTTNGTSSVNSAYELPDLDSNTPVYAFSVRWNAVISGNFPNGADGFSFNFGQLATLNLATNSIFQESGYGAGLSFDVQTYSGNNPGFYVRVGTNVVASSPYTPQTEWGVNNTARHFFEVDWNYYTGMTVRMDGNTIFTNVATTNFIPLGGDRFVWAARCGTVTESIQLDNIIAVTGGNLVALPSAAPYFGNGNDVVSEPLTNAFDGLDSSYWLNSGSTVSYAGARYVPANTVAVYSLTSANYTSAADPLTWTLEGTNNGTIWFICGAGGGYFVNRQETRCWPATNTTAFSTYRIRVAATANPGSGTALGEIRLYALSKVGAPYATWIQTSAPNEPWDYVACSADGQKLAACSKVFGPGDENNNGLLYVSANGGKTWTLSGAPTNEVWVGLASSADGTKLAASQFLNDGHLYLSTNSGATWAIDSAYPQGAGGAAASSADGMKLAVAQPTWGVYTSTNFGTSWTFNNSGLPNGGDGNWTAIASSADGTRLIVGGQVTWIYYSTNSGATWTQSPNTQGAWTSITCSADGMRATAIALNGFSPGLEYISIDGGVSWTYAGTVPWLNYAYSRDGNSSVATDGSHLYTWSPFHGDVSPVTSLGMNLSGNYPLLSWPTANGGNFALQQNTDLAPTNWTNPLWPVVISGTNYQMTVPPIGTASFFRLKTP